MPASTTAPAEEIRRLCELVRDFSGLELPASRHPAVEREVARALATYGLSSASGLLAHLANPHNQLDLEAFTAALTIGETHFFRNRPQVDALRARVLPELIARRSQERRLRIWSAGCSTGEEAYTVAMLIDMLLPRRDGWNISILATDINKNSIDRAQRAVYGSWSFRQVPEEVIDRYFQRYEREFHLAPHIREMVSFSYLNLVEDSYPSLMSNTQGMDLILCRNVLIYFREETINRVVLRLEECLAPGGWLVAGHAESPMPIFRERFVAREFPMAILYQRAEEAQRSPVADRSAQPSLAPGLPARPVEPLAAPQPPRPPQPETPSVQAGPTLEELSGRWRSGDVEAALAGLQTLADRDPADARPLQLAAKILASVLRLDAAEHTVAIALQRDPQSAGTHYLHGLILQELGRPTEALEAFRRCVYLDAGFALGHYALAGLLASTGQRHRADRSFVAAIELIATRQRDEVLDGGDGVTVGRLLDLAEIQRQLIAAGDRDER